MFLYASVKLNNEKSVKLTKKVRCTTEERLCLSKIIAAMISAKSAGIEVTHLTEVQSL